MTAAFDINKISDDDINKLADRIIKGLSARQVTSLHRLSDINQRTDSIHHTLGARPTQASPGDHLHDGGSSGLLLSAAISGSTTTATAAVLKALITLLVPLGIADSTT